MHFESLSHSTQPIKADPQLMHLLDFKKNLLFKHFEQAVDEVHSRQLSILVHESQRLDEFRKKFGVTHFKHRLPSEEHSKHPFKELKQGVHVPSLI